MNASKMFRSLVLGGASLALSACGTPANNNSDAGPGGMDAGPMDAGSTDAGMCVCNPDPSWPGNDCGHQGDTAICCWLQSTAPCCPG